MTAQSGAYASPPMSLNAFREWVNHGERGLSSEAIVHRLTGILLSGRYWSGKDHPADPSDFRRCERLLRQVPSARLLLPLMADVSPVWARFVEEWDSLVALGEEEVPGIFDGPARWSAPRLYERMQEIRYPKAATVANDDEGPVR